MFTGIVENTGKVVRINKEKGNIHFTIDVPFGVCVTTGFASLL